ncbi:MAG: TraB/GumN family protein [Syntrophobacterales bacterium]|jgi:pheromone shutdown-related protein TraB|nr:TraB/GumN family protein [Syntrophobacterales bacterium]
MSHKNITRLSFHGKEIVIIGTAHVSRESADLVEQTILEEKPDTICVELCQSRFDAIRQHDSWREMDIVKVIREKRASLLLAQLLMASFQKRMAEKFHIQPGEEMRRAVSLSDQLQANLVLADRPIRITLLRVWRMMPFRNKISVLPEMFMSLFATDDITEEDIEKLKEQDSLELTLKSFAEKMPVLKTTLIDERDQYLAHMISNAQGTKIVAVVGAGHVPGILKNMDSTIDVDALCTLPQKGFWARSFGWIFSLAVISLFAAGFFFSGSQASINMILSWSLITAGCAAAGATLLFSHPLTIIASALSAPVATLHPLIATGWVAGLVEATIRKPQVKDVLNLANDITSFQGFFRNKITRILIIIAFVNITTSLGTFIAIPIMMKYF